METPWSGADLDVDASGEVSGFDVTDPEADLEARVEGDRQVEIGAAAAAAGFCAAG